MKVQLKDQVALVTGAAGAIGQAICASLAANGAKVVYADINLEGARQLAAATPKVLPKSRGGIVKTVILPNEDVNRLNSETETLQVKNG